MLYDDIIIKINNFIKNVWKYILIIILLKYDKAKHTRTCLYNEYNNNFSTDTIFFIINYKFMV